MAIDGHVKCFALPLSQVAVLARAAVCFAWRTARGEPPEIDIELGVLSSDVQTEQCCGMDRNGTADQKLPYLDGAQFLLARSPSQNSAQMPKAG